MGDFPDHMQDETLMPLMITTFTLFSAGVTLRSTFGAGNPNGTTWVTANTAVYVPLWLPYHYPVRRLFFQTGGTQAGNTDIGIYSWAGAAIFTAGSTANSTTNAPQYITPATPFVLTAGKYYLSMNHSQTASATVYGQQSYTANAGRLGGLYQQAVGATALPSSATFAQWSGTLLPLFGITRTASGF
jgi:hypothetical protein